MLNCRLKVKYYQCLFFVALIFFSFLLVVGVFKRQQTVESEAQSFGTPDAQLTNDDSSCSAVNLLLET